MQILCTKIFLSEFCNQFTCGMLSELIDFELAKDDLKMSTEESARLSWEIESRSKLSQLMLNLIYNV